MFALSRFVHFYGPFLLQNCLMFKGPRKYILTSKPQIHFSHFAKIRPDLENKYIEDLEHKARTHRSKHADQLDGDAVGGGGVVPRCHLRPPWNHPCHPHSCLLPLPPDEGDNF